MKRGRVIFASISEIDAQFGRVIGFLAGMGKLDDTIVVMCADHGDLLGAHGPVLSRIFPRLKKCIRCRLLCVVRGLQGDATCAGRVGLHDLCPTLLELADCEPYCWGRFPFVCRVVARTGECCRRMDPEGMPNTLAIATD